MLKFTVARSSKKNISKNYSLVVGLTKTADCLKAFCKNGTQQRK